jgi:hypothetical protein
MRDYVFHGDFENNYYSIRLDLDEATHAVAIDTAPKLGGR